MQREQVGRIIGAAFGAVFIGANAGALPSAVAIPLRVLAIAAFLAVVAFRHRSGTSEPNGERASGTSFGRRYWLVVAAEVLAIAAGFAVINRVLHTPHANAAWIAFVVGVHFFGLASLWRRPQLRVLGGAMAACGAIGLALALCGASAAIVAAVAGIAPGALLLGSVLWSSRPRPVTTG